MSALLIAAMAMAATPGPADRMGFTHGSDIIARCESQAPLDGSFCLGFVSAVYETVRAYETWSNFRDICVPQTVTLTDMRDAVVKRITQHPDDRLGQGASVVVLALKDTWPCATAPADPKTPDTGNGQKD